MEPPLAPRVLPLSHHATVSLTFRGGMGERGGRKMRPRFTAGLLAAALAAGLMSAGAPQARASSKGRKNFAIGLGALAAYELLRGKTGTGLLAAGGAAYAYKRYNDARKKERRYRYYSSRYSG